MLEIRPSEALWLLRRRKGLSRADAALLLGVTPRALRSWEENRRTPPPPVITEVCRYLLAGEPQRRKAVET